MYYKLGDINMIDQVIVNGDIVYVIEKVSANRSISPKADRKADEVLIFGFNKKKDPELFNKIQNEIKEMKS